MIPFVLSLLTLALYNASLYLVFTQRGWRLLMSIGKRQHKAADPVHQAGTASSTESTPTRALVAFDNRSPLDKEQVLLAVRLYAQSKARYEALTARSRDEWLALCAEATDSGSVSMYYSGQGATMYGSGEIFLKYPDITPQEYMAAWNDTYKAATLETREAILATTVAASV